MCTFGTFEHEKDDMTTGGYDPNQEPYNQNPQGQPPQGPPPEGYYPPPQGSYPPPTQYGQPQYDQQPPQYGQQPQYGQPQYGQQPGYPTPPQFEQNFGGAGQPASLGVRFLARLLDGLIISVVSLLLALIIGGGTAGFGVISAIAGFAYFVVMETQKGQTVGKMALGLSVRGPGGAPKPTLQQSAIRNAYWAVNIIPILGGLLVFIAQIVIAVTINSSPTKQGKHDELAGGTQVIKG